MVEGRDGNLYGTTPRGGSPDLGTVFRLTPDGTFTVLHTFSGAPDGAYPSGELLQASDGYLYGTTAGGGLENRGAIFKMALDGTLTTVFGFTGNSEGTDPRGGLVEGVDGNFYGTTFFGGTSGHGTFFRLTPEGTVTTLLHFADFGIGSGSRNERLVQGLDGNFYGTTVGLDVNAIFRITPSGTFTQVVGGLAGGARPPPDLVFLQASDLYLYGTSVCFLFVSCNNNDTSYFRMDLAGNVEFLTRFERGTTGYLNSLIEARDGNLYGTWKVNLPGSEPGAVVRISNYTNCNDKLTVRYEEGTLHLGFTLMTKTPATFRTWLAVPGPPVRVGQVWSLPVPAIEPALFANLPVPGFPDIGKFFVLTALSTEGGAVCADWKAVDTGAAAASAPAK